MFWPLLAVRPTVSTLGSTPWYTPRYYPGTHHPCTPPSRTTPVPPSATCAQPFSGHPRRTIGVWGPKNKVFLLKQGISPKTKVFLPKGKACCRSVTGTFTVKEHFDFSTGFHDPRTNPACLFLQREGTPQGEIPVFEEHDFSV